MNNYQDDMAGKRLKGILTLFMCFKPNLMYSKFQTFEKLFSVKFRILVNRDVIKLTFQRLLSGFRVIEYYF